MIRFPDVKCTGAGATLIVCANIVIKEVANRLSTASKTTMILAVRCPDPAGYRGHPVKTLLFAGQRDPADLPFQSSWLAWRLRQPAEAACGRRRPCSIPLHPLSPVAAL